MKHSQKLPVSHFPVISLFGFMLIGYHLIAFYLFFYGSFHFDVFYTRKTNSGLPLVAEKAYLVKGNFIALFPLYPVHNDIFVLFYFILFPASCDYRVNVGLLA